MAYFLRHNNMLVIGEVGGQRRGRGQSLQSVCFLDFRACIAVAWPSLLCGQVSPR